MAFPNRYWLTFSSCFVFASLIFISIRPFINHSPIPSLPTIPQLERFSAPKPNVWQDLNETEVAGLLNYLHESPNGLNLTKARNATVRDNYVNLIEVLPPNKTDVLPFLNGTTGSPARWARVTINQGASADYYIADYMVGPIPTDNTTEILPLSYIYNAERNYVRSVLPDIAGLVEGTCKIAEQISDITLDLLGGTVNCEFKMDADGLLPVAKPVEIKDGSIIAWSSFARPSMKSDAWALLKQGLFLKLEIFPDDPDKGKVLLWYYNGILYNSTTAFRAAWKSPEFEKCPLNLDGDWTDIEDFSQGVPNRMKPPPVMISPAGLRYDIDHDENFVSWMGFEFYLATSQVTSLSLFDIRFKGERIIYELGLQEALVNYAGDDPIQEDLLWLDTLFGMGKLMFELVPGYDCPAYASYLSTTYHQGDASHTNKNSICIFEYTADHPLQRHTSAKFVSISRSQYLVVRSVSTVGNYDYTIEYIFYLDGSIEVKVRASGFVFGAFLPSAENSKTQNEYGYKVHDAVATSMHDHVLNFKADFDIAGSANTLQRVGIEPTIKSYPWAEEEGTTSNTMHLTHTPLLKETGLNWPTNSGSMYVIINNESTNVWGEKNGYRVTPGTGLGSPSHVTVMNSTRRGKSAEWSTKDLWVLRQKDTEPHSASPMNYLEPDDPLVDFGKFVDEEKIEQEDLVIFFNLGSHHIPTSGDIPNTLMHTSASSVVFTPFNFHDRDPSRESAQGVRLELDPEGHKARYFGGRYEDRVSLKLTDLEADLSQYKATEHAVTDLSFNRTLLSQP